MRTNQPPSGFWRTKDGRLVKLCDMEEQHILNCIALLESSYEEMMRKMAAQSGRLKLMEEATAKARIDSVLPQHKALKEELKRRERERNPDSPRSFEFEP